MFYLGRFHVTQIISDQTQDELELGASCSRWESHPRVCLAPLAQTLSLRYLVEY